MVLGQSYQLTTDQLRRFDEEGYLVIEDLLTHEFLTELVDRVDGLIEGRYVAQNCIAGAASTRSADDPGRMIKQVMPMKYPIEDVVLAASANHPVIRHVVAQLLRAPDAVLFQQQALIKDPGHQNGTPWHQDDYYWNTGGTAVTAWFPLEPLQPDNGTMWIIPRTHLGPVLKHARAGGVSAFHEVVGGVDDSTALPLLMPLGGVSFHHSKTIHGAHGNRGTSRRIAMAQHYRAAVTP